MSAREPGAITALDHVVVGLGDLEAGALTAALVLGREASWRGSHPEMGTANVLFRLDNTYLELLSPSGEGAVGAGLAAHLRESGDGLFALAFATGDADAFAATLRTDGLDVRVREGHGANSAGGAERTWRSVLLPPSETRGVPIFAIEHCEGALSPAPLPDAPEAAVHALDHVVIFSPDLEGARALYGDVLGLRLALDRTFEARGQRILFFRVGGATVEVVGPADPSAVRAGPDRLWGLAWRVADAEAARRRVAAAGYDVSPVQGGAKPGTRVCTVRGEPLGVATLLIAPE